MEAAYFLLLYLVGFLSLPTSLAKNESKTTETEDTSSVLTRLTQLEIESKQQKQTIQFLESKVERHEDVIEKLEKKLKHEKSEREPNEFINFSGQRVDVEEDLSSSSTTSYIREIKRAARLFPVHVLPNKTNESKHPTNCQDLDDLGHTLNGFYLVKDTKTTANNSNKFQTVYCDFKKSHPTQVKEISMGYVDVKTMGYVDVKTNSEPVKKEQGIHFYAHKGCKSSNNNGIIHFDLVKINLGGGFNSSKGVFTAPRSGLYNFMFNAHKEESNWEALRVNLRVNDHGKGGALTPLGVFPHTIVLHSMLKLKKGDRVDLYKTGGQMTCNAKDPNSHFSGSLLVED